MKIYCVTDKELNFIENSSYTLAAVGKNIFNTKYLRCDFGDNIFYKEKYYSELTFHYWFWKNKLNDFYSNDWIGFCQKRRFWIKKESKNSEINRNNLKDHILLKRPESWNNFDSVICEPNLVNNVKKIKLIKRGLKSLINNPLIFFDKKKQTIKLHFDMHHGYGNLDKAIDLLCDEDRHEFRTYVNNNVSFNPHIMFIAKASIAEKWFSSLFPWLFRCEKIFGFETLHGYDSQRLYAYLAERYLSFWFKKYSKYIEWPYITFSNN
jgi:hypothetical protein